jgi:hypothetical protein
VYSSLTDFADAHVRRYSCDHRSFPEIGYNNLKGMLKGSSTGVRVQEVEKVGTP